MRRRWELLLLRQLNEITEFFIFRLFSVSSYNTYIHFIMLMEAQKELSRIRDISGDCKKMHVSQEFNG